MKPKILIVDDNSMLRQTVRRIIESKFAAPHVFEAGDEKKAFTQIHAHLPDMILMDIMLPGKNGLELTRKIKELYPQMVVIIFTTHNLPEYRKAAFDNGADYFFSKSSPDGRKLFSVVDSILVEAGFNHP